MIVPHEIFTAANILVSLADSFVATHVLGRCGECLACTYPDCTKCINCVSKPRFGGSGTRKQACMRRPDCLSPIRKPFKVRRVGATTNKNRFVDFV